MKKLFCSFLAAIMLLGTLPALSLAQDETITVILDGTTLSFDVPPMLVNDRTLVPMRAIFTALGADVDWDDDTQTAISVKDGVTIRIQIGNTVMDVDGESVPLDAPAMLVSDRTLVPLRAVSEAFGVMVDWQGETETVILTSPQSTPEPSPTATPTPEGTPTPTATPEPTPEPTPESDIPYLLDDTLSEEDTAFINAALAYYMELQEAYDTMHEVFVWIGAGNTKAFYEKVEAVRNALSGQTYIEYKACAQKTSLGTLNRLINISDTQTKEVLRQLKNHLNSIVKGNVPLTESFDFRKDIASLVESLEEVEAQLSLYDISGDYSSVRIAAENCLDICWSIDLN